MSGWAAAAQAASELIGTGLGIWNQQEMQEDALHAQEQENARAAALQREFAQHGVRWRVEDAKRAGIHPVFALSGGGAAFSPSPISVNVPDMTGDFSSMGQSLGRAIASQETPEQREAAHLQREELMSRIDRNYAESEMFRSQAVKNLGGGSQPNQVGPGMPSAIRDPNVFADGGRTAVGSAADRVKVKPSESTSYQGSDPSTAAAKDVLWKKYKIGDGREIWLPNANDAGEALESVSESAVMMALVLRENMRRNPSFLYDNAELLPFGKEARSAYDWSRSKVDELSRWFQRRAVDSYRSRRPVRQGISGGW